MGSSDIRPESWNPPLIVVAGVGIGFESFGILYSDWLARAEVVVTAESLAGSPHLTHKEVIFIKSPVEAIVRRVIELSSRKRVIVLASGDPLFFGIGATFAKHVGSENLLILPNISVVQYFFSKICKPWDDVRFFSLHGRDNREFFFWLRNGKSVVLFTDEKRNPAFIARLVVEYGFSRVTFVVGELLGTEKERIMWGSADQVAEEHWEDPNIVALFPDDAFQKCPGFRDDELYLHQRGLITKREVRTFVLGALCLKPGQILWDLGAGSGSVCIEACSMTPLRMAFAVEKDPTRYQDLVKNTKKWGCGEIFCVQGNAVELVRDLPRPDRVFIGGTGGWVEALLQAIEARCSGLVPVVLTCVTFGTLHSLERYARERGHSFEAFQVNVSRAVPVAESYRFESLNPVWIVRLGFPHPGFNPFKM
ncbi:precorrin-6y C5,15-methyltransferase (decarboxylating) subunit CbiE [Thermodesulforhabdus norvegica]|uniref:Precorrin-6Y C5,15-methyltransferase (Decarboxylating) n=1 Tax=Thermodesulforhabdus norvegica TaxID=39841 RepID=A0A1I4QWC3_9BACT|nr:precorrin-6y C5,15-methyltransferase (decarboxylating) subunit CbiE [Thermodesulforhabdus norvegica]SFM44392.1 precorrin-6Y C5,15-methyltransferase (decarboxylating) [Thermodesulforhabdus norvegica]